MIFEFILVVLGSLAFLVLYAGGQPYSRRIEPKRPPRALEGLTVTLPKGNREGEDEKN